MSQEVSLFARPVETKLVISVFIDMPDILFAVFCTQNHNSVPQSMLDGRYSTTLAGESSDTVALALSLSNKTSGEEI